MRAAFALRIISGKNIYNFAILENLRIFQNCLFTGGVVEGNGSFIGWRARPLSLATLASSPKGRALGMAVQFLVKLQSLRVRLLPHWGAVAQRLRGFESAEPEKTVKRSSRRTGVNLQFFPVGAHFFRIVKGEQPLARCGVGGVQR